MDVTRGSERNKVVVRYKTGKILKGYTHDFSPVAHDFHLISDLPADKGRTYAVRIADLKAVFFVKTLHGNKAYHERKTFTPGDSPRLRGLKIKVRFTDGEIMRGTTLGYNKTKKGFFITPVDPEENNNRVYVVADALRDVVTGSPAEK
jgi:hypothetical protein